MANEVVRIDSQEVGTITVSWNTMSGPVPHQRDTLLDSSLKKFLFTHCCDGVMNLATSTSRTFGWVRDVLACHKCNDRLVIGSAPTLRALLLKGWPKEMLAPALGESQEV